MGRLQSVGMLSLLVLLAAQPTLGQCCGDCDGDGHVGINELVTAVNRALVGCTDDGICEEGSCQAELAMCRDDLADCEAEPGVRRFPASGQTTSYGPGSDGDVRAGAALSYTDNGDGTVTDDNTGLMWEKKDRSGGIHDTDNFYYTWGMTSPPYTMNGTMVTEFLATLNTQPCFAGHCDWRIPNVKELQSIVDYEEVGPAVSAAFNTDCVDGCTVRTCSCTASTNYWSSTTYAYGPRFAWDVDFSFGLVPNDLKANRFCVRAVRGGL